MDRFIQQDKGRVHFTDILTLDVLDRSDHQFFTRAFILRHMGYVFPKKMSLNTICLLNMPVMLSSVRIFLVRCNSNNTLVRVPLSNVNTSTKAPTEHLEIDTPDTVRIHFSDLP